MRLSHLSAVAVMIALVGAMFVAMGSVSAEALGPCSATGPTTLGVGDMCTVPVANGTVRIDDPIVDSGTAPSLGKANQIQSSNDAVASVTADGTVQAASAGSATITVREYTAPVSANPNSNPPVTGVAEKTVDTTYRITVSTVAVTKIEFGSLVPGLDEDGDPITPPNLTDDTFTADTDNVFAAGTDVHVRVTSSFSEGNDVSFTVSVPTTGLSLSTINPIDSTGEGTTQRKTSVAGNTSTNRDAGKVTVTSRTGDFILVTDGAPDGTYTVTAQATNGGNTSKKFTTELIIGEAGNAVSDASLELGLKEGPPDTNPANDEQESGSVGRTGAVNLVLSITNGIDNPVNAADVDEIRVVAPFGVVKYYKPDGMLTSTASNEVMPSHLVKGSVVINVASDGGKARTIDVYAIVLGKAAGVATTTAVPLSFTGDAASVDLADATENLRSINLKDEMDSIKLMVTAADSSGNTAAVPDPLTITVHDPDGKQLPIGNDQKLNAERMTEPGKVYIKVTNRSGNDASTALKAGEYTVKVKSGSIDDSAMFTVVGTTDSIDVEVGETNDNGEFEVTVTAMDAAGKLVADGTPVMVEAPDLRGDADKVLFLARSDGKTTAGMAKAKLVEIGPGNAAIVVTVDGVTKVERYTSTYGAEEEAITEPEMVGNHCIENKGGFAVWTCGVSAMASEVFALAQPEGATAIHLWSTISMSWVRYSVVDGAMVPGSSDFMVTKSDILYISN